jgi:uncharacterized protein
VSLSYESIDGFCQQRRECTLPLGLLRTHWSMGSLEQHMRRHITQLIGVFTLVVPALSGAAQPSGAYDPYYGNYRLSADHVIGINPFIMDSGEKVVLFADYSSGVVRRLFPNSDSEFVIGPGFNTAAPAELTLQFVKGESSGKVKGISLRRTNETPSFAERVPLTLEEVSFVGADAKLSGTLLMPATEGPHPAIILLHGSGPLTRYSFGPYPHFFTSLGFAVLIFDKRGTGVSSGTRLDASTGASAPIASAYYPDHLVADALAVFRFLQHRPEIDASQIGLWGSSEGGMLTTQVAARNKDVAFAINSSGFVGPLWEPIFFQAGANLKSQGYTEEQAEEAWEFARLWMRVARTGADYELFVRKRAEAIESGKLWLLSYYSGAYTSLEQMRWDWDHILAFDSTAALKKVSCPVLGVFGAKDPLTDAAAASGAMLKALSDAGNKDFTVKVFPNAGHSLMELPSGSRMTPGVFDTLRAWLLQRIVLAEPADPSNGELKGSVP